MHEQGQTPERPYVKSARVVGDVMGKYHPHGDASIYFTLVRMTQSFSMGLVLIDGQGNFGSVDGDMPAAMRYTECRMAPPAMALLADLDKDTVDFADNYDGKEQEPTVLPSRVPNLLVNGAGGIAVGMATNIPPHNLGEVIDACLLLIDEPEVTTDQLLDLVPGPDFPTGGEIIGRAAPRQALLTGRGSVVMRGVASVEELRAGREAIIVTEIPYQVNKANLVEHIAELVRDKKIEGVADIRDESNRDGMRIVVELKRDASGEVILNQLYRFTALQTSFGVNMLALNRGRPEQMGLRKLLEVFVEFREEVVVRRTKFELSKARDRGHVLVGLTIAVANIDEFIHIIRSSKDPTEARERLVAKAWPAGDMLPLVELIADPRTIQEDGGFIRLTDEQARAILALTLSRLTGLGRDEIGNEAAALADAIRGYLDLLSDRANIMAVVREELVEVRDKFAIERRSRIVDGEADVEDEDLIVREEMVITVTMGGYVKRTPLTAYRTQHRGGKGKSGMATKTEDAVTRVFSASTHAPLLFFTSGGKVYKMKVWRLPLGVANSRGKAFVNLLPIEPGETITSILALPEDEATWDSLDVMFATRSGSVRRNKLSDFVDVRRNGKIAMKLEEEGDEILSVETCKGPNLDINEPGDDVLLTTALGQAIRFPVDEVRVFAGRNSIGVRGLTLAEGDRLISMTILGHVDAEPWERAAYLKRSAADRRAAGVDEEDIALVGEEVTEEGQLGDERYEELKGREQFVLTVSEKGYGKRSSSYDFRTSGRGGKGIRATDTSKTAEIGELVAAFPVEDKDQIMLVSDGGVLIRVPVGGIRIASRATKGVTIFSTAKDEKVVSVERISEPEGEDEVAAELDESGAEAGIASEGAQANEAGEGSETDEGAAE